MLSKEMTQKQDHESQPERGVMCCGLQRAISPSFLNLWGSIINHSKLKIKIKNLKETNFVGQK